MGKIGVSVSIDEDIKVEIEKRAKDQERSVSYIAEKLIKKALEEEKTKK
jgi:predicted transcriptional regulator